MVYVLIVIEDKKIPHINAVYYLESRAKQDMDDINKEEGKVAWIEESYLI